MYTAELLTLVLWPLIIIISYYLGARFAKKVK